MKFDKPATTNPIDRGRVVGIAQDRVDGAAKVTGTAPYAYERHDVAPNAAYGWIVGSAIAKGRIGGMDLREAKAAPGVIAIVTKENAGALDKAFMNRAHLLGGPEIQHFDQALALVVAETFEQARDAARLVRIDYVREDGKFDLAAEKDKGIVPPPFFGRQPESSRGDFEGAFAKAAIKFDRTYTTPDQSHMMMEPHSTTAAWAGSKLTLWTSTQMVGLSIDELARTLKMDPKDIHLMSPYVGGGFGAKLFLRADILMASLGARIAKRPVKVAIARPQIPNNTVHRPATIQRIRIGADRNGVIDAIAHESWSGNLPGGGPEPASLQTRSLYRGNHRKTTERVTHLDLPEGSSMRAPGEAVGMLALEIAMDELAETCGVDPIELRIRNDVQYDPETDARRPFSSRKLVECLRVGAENFGWSKRNPKPGQIRDGDWLVGMGVASAFRGNLTTTSAARVRVDGSGQVTVETDMTDIGTGSYTILAQIAAEMLGVPIGAVDVRLGDSRFPRASGSGGQLGANSSASGLYAACTLLRAELAQRAGFNVEDALFEDGMIKSAGRTVPLRQAAGRDGVSAEDKIEFGDLSQKYAQATFGAHFCEVGVDRFTGEIRVRRMGGAFAAGRIINPKAARNQIIGSMTMGVGAALMEELVVDKRFGYFVNHDMAEYHIPVHADIPEQNIVFLSDEDDKSSPLKAKGVGELGICGAGAAVANAIYNACGARLRDFPLTLDKVLRAQI